MYSELFSGDFTVQGSVFQVFAPLHVHKKKTLKRGTLSSCLIQHLINHKAGLLSLHRETNLFLSEPIYSLNRLIDTAQGYPDSEPQVAEAIAQSGIPRSEVFIITKLHPRYLGYDTTLAAIEMSLKNLKTDYIDLYLIHTQQCDEFLLICEEGKFVTNNIVYFFLL